MHQRLTNYLFMTLFAKDLGLNSKNTSKILNIIIHNNKIFTIKTNHTLLIINMNEDQQKILEDAKKRSREFAYFMKKELEVANLRGALKHSACMLEELKTSALSPKGYYQLWMVIFAEMREMEKYFKEEAKRGRKMKELYASVQQSPSLIPRLYLLIAVGSVYIQSHEQGSKSILYDIIEMLRGVQNPLRGLYTRYYFLKICKDRLPDAGSEYEEEGYGINQAFDIIYTNLRQSVSLWTRLSMGKDKSRKEKERGQLKMLIGENLSRLSSLQGLTLQVYISTVLPKLMELVSNSKDPMAQEYILDCMIQGFPEQFHIKTLSELLGLCANQLQKQVNVKTIFISLMDRLSGIATSSNQSSQNIYEMFKENILVLIQKADSMQFKNVLKLESSFLKFTQKCYPKNVKYVSEILSLAVATCKKNDDYDEQAQNIISEFLITPLESMPVDILTMSDYSVLMSNLKFIKRRSVALHIVKTVTKLKLQLIDETLVSNLLKFIEPLLKTGSDYVENSQLQFADEQTFVSKLMFLIHSNSVEQIWPILKMVIDQFKQGGSTRIKFTYPCTLFRLFQFAKQVSTVQNVQPIKVYKKIFTLSRELIDQLSKIQPLKSLLLTLQFVLTINLLDKQETFDEFVYDVLTEGLELYGTYSTDADVKTKYLKIIIGSIQKLQCLSQENYNNIADNATQYASKILKKNQQAVMLLQCLCMFNNKKFKNQQRISQIFKKCIKLAKTCIGSSIKNVTVLMQLVNSFAYFDKHGYQKNQQLQACIDEVLEKYPQFEKEAQGDPVCESYIKFWSRTKQYLNNKVAEGIFRISAIE